MYKFKFKYEWIKPKGSIPRRRKGDAPALRATSVKIYDGVILIATGHTIQSVNDPDIKVIARKVAMTNALDVAVELDRSKRTEVWKAFFEQINSSITPKDLEEEIEEIPELSEGK